MWKELCQALERQKNEYFLPFCHGSHNLGRGIPAMHKTSSTLALTSYTSFTNSVLGTQSRQQLILFMVCVHEKQEVAEKALQVAVILVSPPFLKLLNMSVTQLKESGVKRPSFAIKQHDAEKITQLTGLTFFCYIIPGEVVEKTAPLLPPFFPMPTSE